MNSLIRWNKIKFFLRKSKGLYFNERDVFMCCLGLNIGDEQNGSGNYFLRPVLIIKKFNNKICLVVPMTTTYKSGRYYFNNPFTDKTS